MLAQLRIRGFYLIPGVPSITHVKQATDRNDGFFKSVYQDNLVKLNEYKVREKSGKNIIQPTDIHLLIFGIGPQ